MILGDVILRDGQFLAPRLHLFSGVSPMGLGSDRKLAEGFRIFTGGWRDFYMINQNNY